LEKEESQLASLLDKESIDRSAVSGQITRVIQARGEMERVNSTMTLEMREHLTRAQWTQLRTSAAGGGLPYVRPTTVPAAATPAPSGAVRIGAQVAQSNLISSVQPQYPAIARAARVQGTVILNVVISKEGSVSILSVASGHDLLVDAAIQAVQQWRYKPIHLNGQPIDAITTISVNFVLR
jgi:TonB family protein